MTSNKTIATLMVVAMLLALFGMVISLNRIEGISKLATMTGAWTEGTSTYGAVNISITSQLKINFSDDAVNFSAGYVLSGYSSCIIGTDGTNTSGCYAWNVPNGLILENTGNQPAQVNLSNTNHTSSFFQGTGAAKAGYAMKIETPESLTNRNVTCNESVAAAEQNLNLFFDNAGGSYRNMTSSDYPGEPAGTGKILCNSFNASDTTDIINISFKFVIPNDVYSSGDMMDRFTATATAA
ncbi:MAG: hypothetical protein ABIB71_04965 [Candidatus Woesearchaeota archaeon]